MNQAYIIDACRTPRGIGKIGKGALAHLHPQHLAATVLGAIAERNSLDTSHVDDVIWSTSTQVGKQGRDLGGMAAPPLFGWLLDSGRPGLIFTVTTAFMLVTVVMALGQEWRLRHRRLLSGAPAE